MVLYFWQVWKLNFWCNPANVILMDTRVQIQTWISSMHTVYTGANSRLGMGTEED
jgi:hypothetical protein